MPRRFDADACTHRRGQHAVAATLVGGGVTLLGALALPLLNRPADAPTTASAPHGDARVGAQLYAQSCVGCHGARGEGMPLQGAALAGSAWVSGANDAALAALLRDGRTADAPGNTSGRAMPPRGGNPNLADRDLADLAAHVRALAAGDAAPVNRALP